MIVLIDGALVFAARARRGEMRFSLPALGMFLICARLVSAFPDERARAHATAGVRLAQAGDLQRAEAELREAVRLAPANSVYLSDFASVLRANRKPAEAVAHYRRAMSADSGNPVIRRNLALALADLGQTAPAIAELRKVVRQVPGDTLAVSALAAALYQSGAPAEAGRVAQQLMDSGPVAPEVLVSCAQGASAADDHATTVKLLLTAVQLGGRTPPVYSMLGHAYWRNGELRNAMEAFRSAIEGDPGNPQHCLDMARLLSTQNSGGPRWRWPRKRREIFRNQRRCLK
jgi:Flp pilus assembly protein TadD